MAEMAELSGEDEERACCCCRDDDSDKVCGGANAETRPPPLLKYVTAMAVVRSIEAFIFQLVLHIDLIEVRNATFGCRSLLRLLST
jgi:hypothetical protein